MPVRVVTGKELLAGSCFRTLRATAGQAASNSGGSDTARPCFTSEGLDSGQAWIPKQEAQKEQFQWEGKEKWQIFQAYQGLPLSLFHLVTKIITFEHLLHTDSTLSDADMRTHTRRTWPCLPRVPVGMPDLNHHQNKHTNTRGHER